MRKLIYVDSMSERLESVIRIGGKAANGEHPISAECVLSVLESLQTVDAIPVSWIMARVAERKERGTAFDLSVASTLRTMVEEWREEETAKETVCEVEPDFDPTHGLEYLGW